jgi:hypothetical protein
MNEIPLMNGNQLTNRMVSPVRPEFISTDGIAEEPLQEKQDIWQEWRPSGKLPKPRSYHSAVYYNNTYKIIKINSMLVFGGRDNIRGSYGDIYQLFWD